MSLYACINKTDAPCGHLPKRLLHAKYDDRFDNFRDDQYQTNIA
ncbi:hypothetical protein SAMN06265222_106331 [Neorhodopirellula lusitana]|uniref:Uncharacterized protein n=1 Tax=Neorhodopirellula lusitana TaxID=445327 RepID=A0ABY1Q6K7_9BACT|nr:hypothetical protein [Neorhodopirellula lusitana]SMP60235.1 hypothetical protein SAMN06265222_106331 [Neorhodopirellula lusitana]